MSPLELRTGSPPWTKTQRRRGNVLLPTEFGIVVMRAGQHVEARERRAGVSADQRRRPAHLLQVAGAVRRFDLLELATRLLGPHHFHPAIISIRR